jgi:hypothetical protein
VQCRGIKAAVDVSSASMTCFQVFGLRERRRSLPAIGSDPAPVFPASDRAARRIRQQVRRRRQPPPPSLHAVMVFLRNIAESSDLTSGQRTGQNYRSISGFSTSLSTALWMA